MSWPMPPLCSCPTSSTGTTSTAWDAGITWRSLRTVDPVDLPLEVGYIRDKVLRVVNDSVEDGHIERLIIEATEAAEEETQRALMPQTWQMILSGFPSGDIVLERPPLIEVLSFDYLDADGASQTLAVSPLDFQVIPSGKYRKARLRPLSGASWPGTISTEEAVTITYRAGFSNDQDPQLAHIARGIALMTAEGYKTRTLSIVGTSVSQATLHLERFWKKVY